MYRSSRSERICGDIMCSHSILVPYVRYIEACRRYKWLHCTRGVVCVGLSPILYRSAAAGDGIAADPVDTQQPARPLSGRPHQLPYAVRLRLLMCRSVGEASHTGQVPVMPAPYRAGFRAEGGAASLGVPAPRVTVPYIPLFHSKEIEPLSQTV